MALQGITTQSLAVYLKPLRWPQIILHLHRIILDWVYNIHIKCLDVEFTKLMALCKMAVLD